MNIAFTIPDIGELEIDAVTDVLRSGWITTGPRVKQFEERIGEYCGTQNAVCLSSNTAAQELLLRRLGVGPGDEVITSAYTYTASASVIAHVGAKIVLVDVEPGSYRMDCQKLSAAINERTKAVIPVDIGGVTENYEGIFAVVESKKHLFQPANEIQAAYARVIVAADAAHSFGARWHTQRSGSVADFTSFSFHAVKNLTTAEGGAITWRDHEGLDSDALAQWFKRYSLHGQTKDAASKTKLGTWEYDVEYPAYKMNMTDIAAAMGLTQLDRYEEMMNQRRRVIRAYNQALLPSGVEVLDHFVPGCEGNGHLYMMRIPGLNEAGRNRFIAQLAKAGIAANVHFKPLPMLSAYRNLGFDIANYPFAYAQYANEVTLPLHTRLTDEEIAYVTENVKLLLEERK